MRGAGRLYALQLGVGALGIGLVAGGAVAVMGGAQLGVPSSEEISAACHNWIGAGGPAALLGLAITALAATAVVLGARSARRQVQATAAHLSSLPLGPTIEIDGTSARVVEREAPQAFCAGLLRPHVYVSRGALEQLTDGELRAVIAHERHHSRWRDPLRRVLGRALGDALFFIPVLGRIADRHGTLEEIEADRAAIASVGDKRALASALLKFDQPETAAGVVAVAPERVDHLVGDPGATRWRLPSSAVVRSAAALVVLAALVLLVWHGIVNPTLEIPLLLAAACMFLMVGVPALAAVAAALISVRGFRARGT
jgi:hypothetical protein